MVYVLRLVRNLNFQPDNLWENEGVSFYSQQLNLKATAYRKGVEGQGPEPHDRG